jgi:hypothetical protein
MSWQGGPKVLRSRLRFSLGMLLFLLSAVAAFLGGRKAGYDSGFKAAQKPGSEAGQKIVRMHPNWTQDMLRIETLESELDL